MNLCCKINPTRQCTECKVKFCEEHVFTPPKLYSGDKALYPSQCFSCLNEKRAVQLSKCKSTMTARDLFIEVRKLVPNGFLQITFQVVEGRPDSGFASEWRVYHETWKDARGATAEAAYESFKAKVHATTDPNLTDLGKVF